MNTVYFDTPGLLDMRAVTTFGLSVKENENPIGYFGTGLKYAIAILMRNGASLFITNSSGDSYQFTIQTQEFRNKEFNAVCMNDKEMPFTTELGKNWKIWMAFRELYCNTKDEDGVCHISDKGLVQDHADKWDDWTRIAVCDEDLYEAYSNRREYFLEDVTPDYVGDNIEIFNRVSAHMFYKRIRVGDLRYSATMTYNHTGHMEMTEDRTLSYSYQWDSAITYAITRCTDVNTIRAFVLAPESSYEANATFADHISTISEAFKEVMKPLAFDHSGRVNRSAQDLYKKIAREKGEAFIFVNLSRVQESMFTKAANACIDLGHHPSDVEIFFVKSLGSGILGIVIQGRIYLSIETFDMGTKMLTGTLMEELIHHEQGIDDYSRELQNFLVNRIMSLYEETKGEPL